MKKLSILLSLLLLLTLLVCSPIVGHGDEKLVPDPNLERAIRQNLNKPKGEITVSDLESLKTLVIAPPDRYKQLDFFPDGPPSLYPVFRSPYLAKDLTGLEYAVNLGVLYIVESPVSDLSPILELSNLTTVLLTLTDVRDISSLADMPNLKSLWVSFNGINFDNLSGFDNLEELWIYGEEITDLSIISELTNLEYLYLWSNKITDLSPLANHPSLRTLEVNDNNLREIDSLLEISCLDAVDISYNFLLIDESSQADTVIDKLLDQGVNIETNWGQSVYPLALGEDNAYSQSINGRLQWPDDFTLKVESSEPFEGHILFAIKAPAFTYPDVGYLSEEFDLSTRYNMWGYLYMEMLPEEPGDLTIAEMDIPLIESFKEYVTEDKKIVDENGMRLHYYNKDLQVWELVPAVQEVQDASRLKVYDMEFKPGLYCIFPLSGATSDIVYGDVNRDGEINVQDAIKILRYIVNLEQFSPRDIVAADVRKDDTVCVNDAILILRYITGLIDAF